MSLINQALRKAQRDRTPNRMAQPGEQSPVAYASSAASGMSPALVISLVIAVALLIGLVVGLSVVIFKGDSTPPQQVATTPPATPEPGGSSQTATPPAISTTVGPQITQPETTAPVVEARVESGVVGELRKAREAAEAEVAARAKAAAEKEAAEAEKEAAEAIVAEKAAARAAAQPSEDIITWLGSAKLSGVKISETESKVILNGRPYAVGEYVNFKLGLKIMIIQEERVLFVDNNGKKYMKRL